MSLNYGLGKTNCLTYIPNDIKLEINKSNVTIVGTPTLSGGFVSNLSGANYLKLPNSFNPGSNPWEMVFKVKPSTSTSTNKQIIGGINSDSNGLEFGINKDNKFVLWLGSTNSSYDIANGAVGTYVVQMETTYWVKVSFDGSKYVLAYSLNGSEYINDIVINSTKTIYGDTKAIGADAWGNGASWGGSIEISQSYIKINDQMWWQGGLGQVRLKKGSIVYVPDGILDGKKQFKKIILEEDTPYQNTGGSGNGLFINYSPSDNRLRITSKVSTASENPNQDYSIWYDLTNNYLHRYGYDQDGSVDYICSLPIGVVSQIGSAVTSIDQVFNGFGYIGGFIYSVPGIKANIPYGWNEDGTYKNIVLESKTIQIRTEDYAKESNRTILSLHLWDTDDLNPLAVTPSAYTYDSKQNKNFNVVDNSLRTIVKEIGTVTRDTNGIITSMTIHPIQTTNESANIESIEYGVGKTNCLTELPNDIKYSLTPSTLKVSGTPTVTTSGVASNFSKTNYFTTNINFSPNSNTWEIGSKFIYKITNDNQVVFDMNDGTNGIRPITCYVHNDDHIRYGLSSDLTTYFNGGEMTGKTILTDGTTYWLKASFNGSKYTFNLSTDGTNWIEDYSYESTTKVYSGLPMQIGWWKGGTAFFTGSIYLNECYIKYNDVEQWRGRLGSITIKKGSKLYYPNGFNTDGTKRFDEIILEKDYSYIECANSTYPLYYSPNINNIFRRGVGNIAGVETNKVTNGAYYATDTNKFYTIGTKSDGSAYEYQVAMPIATVTTTFNGVTSAHIFNGIGYINNIYFTTPGIKYLEPNGWNEDGTYKSIARKTDKVKISWLVGSTDTVTNRAMCMTNGVNEADWMTDYHEVQSRSDVTSNNWYYIKDENNIYSQTSTTRAPRTKIGTMQVTNGNITNFKVDAIKSTNDSYPIKEIHQCVGKTNCLTYIPNDIKIDFKPLNVTIVGSPTINRGVASNFTTANYLMTPKSINLNSVNTWELVIAFTGNKGSLLQQKTNTPNVVGICYNGFAVRLDGNSTWTWLVENLENDGNTKYWHKLIFNGSSYIAYRSTDGVEYTQVGILNTTTKVISNTQPFTIGINDVLTDPFGGSIDLPNCYIKINNQVWWQGGIGQCTLKKGSKVYKPDGSYRITESDMTSWMTDVSNRFYYVRDDNNAFTPYALSTTGTAPTTTSGNEIMFNTSNNHIEYYANGTYVCDCSLPVCFGNNNKNIQVFNGIGFMGSTLFALPGIKGLISNGWNEDGTYKNIQYENKNVLICNGWNNDTNNRYIYIGTYPYSEYNNALWTNIKTFTYEQPTEPTAQEGNVYWIDTKNNIIKYTNNKGQSWTETKLIAMIGDTVSTNSKITSMSLYPIPIKNNTRIIYKK